MRGCSCCCWPPYMPAGDRSAPGGAGRQMQKGAGAGRRLVPAREPRLGRDTPSGGGQSPAAASPSPGGRPAGSGPAASSAQGRPGAGSGAEPRLAPPSAGRRWGGAQHGGAERTRPRAGGGRRPRLALQQIHLPLSPSAPARRRTSVTDTALGAGLLIQHRHATSQMGKVEKNSVTSLFTACVGEAYRHSYLLLS